MVMFLLKGKYNSIWIFRTQLHLKPYPSDPEYFWKLFRTCKGATKLLAFELIKTLPFDESSKKEASTLSLVLSNMKMGVHKVSFCSRLIVFTSLSKFWYSSLASIHLTWTLIWSFIRDLTWSKSRIDSNVRLTYIFTFPSNSENVFYKQTYVKNKLSKLTKRRDIAKIWWTKNNTFTINFIRLVWTIQRSITNILQISAWFEDQMKNLNFNVYFPKNIKHLTKYHHDNWILCLDHIHWNW